MLEFYEKFSNNKLKPTLKSEKIPKINNGTVIKVVGKTFKKIVLDDSKDVLVKFILIFIIIYILFLKDSLFPKQILTMNVK